MYFFSKQYMYKVLKSNGSKADKKNCNFPTSILHLRDLLPRHMHNAFAAYVDICCCVSKYGSCVTFLLTPYWEGRGGSTLRENPCTHICISFIFPKWFYNQIFYLINIQCSLHNYYSCYCLFFLEIVCFSITFLCADH